MAQVALSFTIIGPSGKLILLWKKASNPSAEVGRAGSGGAPPLSPSNDFPIDTTYVIPDLQPVVYIVEFWRSDDGSTLDQFLRSWSVDASKNAAYGETKYEYVVGRGYNNVNQSTGPLVWADPVDSDVELNDERWAGAPLESVKIESRGHGPYRDDEFVLTSTGFTFAGSSIAGTQFSDGDTFFVYILNKSSLPVFNSTDGGYSDVKELRDDVDNTLDYDDTFYGKLCYANFSGTNGKIVFPDFDLIPDHRVKFVAHRGSQNYLQLQFNAGDMVYHLGESKNVIYLEKGAEIELLFKDNVCYVLSYRGNEQMRGQVAGDYNANRVNNGAFILADESVGVLNKSDYEGLYAWLLTLPVGVTVSAANWPSNKQRYMLETSNQTFRFPHLANMHRRFRETTEAPGTYQADAVGPHQHPFKLYENGTGNSNDFPAVTDNDNIFKDTGRTDNNDGVGSASETRVKAYKEIPLIYL